MRKLIMIAALLAAGSAVADIVRVTIPIDGALCGFCMAGIESRFKSTQPGMTGYRLSIRERIADLEFDGTRPVDVEALRKIIADYGYTPRDPIVTVRGTVQRAGESELWLQGANVKERYRLLGSLSASEANGVVIVTGTLESKGETRTLRIAQLPPGNTTAVAEPREERQPVARVAARDWQTEFAPEHLLQHVETLKLSNEQVAALKKVDESLQEELRKHRELITHCDGEVFETLAQRMILAPEDERFILHEVEEITEAQTKVAVARARAALAAWKELQPGQRKRWIEIVTKSAS